MKDNNITVSSTWVKMVLNALEQRGLDKEKLCRDVGIEYEALSNVDSRVCQERLSFLWMKAVEESGNLDIGLAVSSPESISALDGFIYVFMSCASLKSAYQQVIRFRHIIADAIDIALTERDGYCSITYELNNKLPAVKQSYDAILGSSVALAKWASFGRVRPVEVHFTQPEPINFAAYQAIFDCRMLFNQRKNSVVFYSEDMNAPMATANKLLADHHRRILHQTLNPFIRRVREELVKDLASGKPPVEEMAARFAMPQRTFQRRLMEEGWSYRALTDDTRKMLAKNYVCEGRYGSEEIIRMLGFAEYSAFIRAFKRWYQKTPSQYRRMFEIEQQSSPAMLLNAS